MAIKADVTVTWDASNDLRPTIDMYNIVCRRKGEKNANEVAIPVDQSHGEVLTGTVPAKEIDKAWPDLGVNDTLLFTVFAHSTGDKTSAESEPFELPVEIKA